MNKLFTLLIALLLTATSIAQSPNKFNYQAVARDLSGNVLSNQDVSVRIAILEGSASGSEIFAETHDVTTNGFGLFNFQIGSGTSIMGDLGMIDWGANSYFMHVAFDGSGGTNYTELSTTELVSVPYAMFANSVLNDSVADDDADPTNEIQALSRTGDVVYLSNGGSVDLSDLGNSVIYDNDSTNELQQLSISNDTIFLTDGGAVLLPAEIDGSVSNEIQVLSLLNDTLFLSDGGSVDLSLYANAVNYDNDSTNEIQSLSFGNDTLILSNGGMVDLSGYANELNHDNDSTNEIQSISISGDSIFLDNGGFVVLPAEVDGSITNELQALTLSNDTLYLSDGGSVLLSEYVNEVNLDNDSTNEIQSISISGDTVFLDNGGFVVLPAEVDGSTSNELQALTLSNDTLYLSDGGSVLLSEYVNEANLDNDSTNEIQSISINGDTIHLENGGFVVLPDEVDGSTTNELQLITLSNDTIYLSDGGSIDLSNYVNDVNLDNDSTNELQTLMMNGDTIQLTDGGFIVLPAEVDGSITNEIQVLSISNDTIYLSDGGHVTLPNNGLADGTQAGNTPYWNGSNWVVNSNNISNTGNHVGIGTDAPDNKLHVQDSLGTHVAIQLENSDAIAGMELESAFATTPGEAILNIGVHTARALGEKGNDPRAMWMRIDSRSSDKSFDWYYEGQGSNTEYKLMELDSAGRLTLNEAYTLPNADGTNGQTLVSDGAGAVAWSTIATGDADWTISGNDIYTGVTGNVGIGTTNPAAKLTIANNVASGGLDNYSEYQLVLYQTANAANAYGLGVRGSTFVVNTDGVVEIDVDANTAWTIHEDRIEPKASGNSVFLGTSAGQNDDHTDNRNVAVGYGAFNANTTGYHSVAVGDGSLNNNTTGHNNVAIGHLAGYSGTASEGVTAIGSESAYSNTSNHITAVGYAALRNNTTGAQNTAIGAFALDSNTTGTNNTIVGYHAGSSNTTNSGVTAVGYAAAQNNAAHYTTAFGDRTLQSNTTGAYNTALGGRAMQKSTTGSYNTAVGYGANYENLTGSAITAIGHHAANKNTQDGITAIGDRALYSNTTGQYNVGVGYRAGYTNSTSGYNTAIGYRALDASTGHSNTGVGAIALYDNTTGTQNTAVGRQALSNITIGHANTAVGYNALVQAVEGSGNTAIGRYAGVKLSNDATSDNNTFLGVGSGATTSASITRWNTICIGYNAPIFNPNRVVIGNSGITHIGGYASWSTYSDGRFKKKVKENVPGIDFIIGLRPVTYEIDIDGLNDFIYGDEVDEEFREMTRDAKQGIVESGFIAQEVEAQAQKLGFDFNGVVKPTSENEHYALSYASFVVPLVKATQEQQQIIEDQQAQIDELKAMIQALMKDQ